MFDVEERTKISDFLKKHAGTVYIGCDSQRIKKRQARYTVVLVVHINDCEGCKIFGYTTIEKDFDAKKNKPRMRLMNEVYKTVETYLEFAELLEDRKVEIHVDVNSDESCNSHIVFNEAFGYVLGMTGIKPKMKPEAFIASHTADHMVRKATCCGMTEGCSSVLWQ